MKVTELTRTLLAERRKAKAEGIKAFESVSAMAGSYTMNAGPWARRGTRPRPLPPVKRLSQDENQD